MRYIQSVRIVRFPDGSIKHPPGVWKSPSPEMAVNDLKILYTRKLGSKDRWPLTIYDVRAGVLSRYLKENNIISLPTLNL